MIKIEKALNSLYRKIAGKQDALTAGQNITIEGGVISAAGTDLDPIREAIAGKQDIINLRLEGNTLLFSFDGLSRRYGKMHEIETLCAIFNDEPLHSFFTNASEILAYKRDLWDVLTFSKMLSLSPLETPTMVREEPATHNRGITKFERYLSKDSRTLFLSLHSQDKTLREAYQIVRENYPDDFRKAMKQFLRENPQATIYGK